MTLSRAFHRGLEFFRITSALAVQELKAQRRETLFGFFWTLAWPMLQAGGLFLAFQVLRGAAVGDLLTTYAGVLVWTSLAGVVTSGFAILRNNLDLIRHMSFPFHLIASTDAFIRFGLFAVQCLPVSLWVMTVNGVATDPVALLGLVMFLGACFMAMLAMEWGCSLAGAVAPDAAMASGPMLMLLMALSPIFVRAGQNVSDAVRLINDLNPFSHVIESYFTILGVDGRTPSLPWGLFIVSFAGLLVMRRLMKKLFLELAKIL